VLNSANGRHNRLQKVATIVCLGAIVWPALCAADTPEPESTNVLEDFRFGVSYTNIFAEEGDDGLSLIVEYHLFGPVWVGGHTSWHKTRISSQLWPAGALRMVFPGTDVADFQALMTVGGNGKGVNFRTEAGPIWKLKYVDVSLAVSFLAVSIGHRSNDLRGFGFTLSLFAPGH